MNDYQRRFLFAQERLGDEGRLGEVRDQIVSIVTRFSSPHPKPIYAGQRLVIGNENRDIACRMIENL